MSRKHLPAAVLVSIGCSVALRDAPRAFTVRTMSCKSPMLRAKRLPWPMSRLVLDHETMPSQNSEVKTLLRRYFRLASASQTGPPWRDKFATRHSGVACGPSPAKILSRVSQSGHDIGNLAQYVEKPLDSLRRAGDYFLREARMRERLR